MIFSSICFNACWFQVTYHFPMVTPSDSVKHILLQINNGSLIICDLIDFLVYLNFIIVYLNFVYVTLKRDLKRRLENRVQYRYQIFSAPLLYDYN